MRCECGSEMDEYDLTYGVGYGCLECGRWFEE